MNKLPVLLLFIIVFLFFSPFFFQSKLPIPSDTIVGMYHPFRDLYIKDYPRGIPFKNFLITDPVRQQFPWKNMVVQMEKMMIIPNWNPYNFSGSPLLANFQSSSFYVLNFIFFFPPFYRAWGYYIFLQPLLASLFMFLYLKNLKLKNASAILGSFAFAFCGFSISWMEWGNILQTALWLPLILFSIDKLAKQPKILSFWPLILIFSLISSFFAGHIQIFFYILVTSLVYSISKGLRNKHFFLPFLFCLSLAILITSVQWIPTFRFISLSARGVDQIDWLKQGWFIPWQNLIQFVIPDYFGNPATLNYWGVWNYGEFAGYVGILPLLMAIFALFFRRDKKVLFFGLIFFSSLFFAFPTILAKLPYILQIPFLSTSQPTRLIFLVDFSLSVLAALGLDYFWESRKQILFPLISFFLFLLFLFLLSPKFLSVEEFSIAKRNMIIPFTVFILDAVLLLIFIFDEKKKLSKIIIILLLLINIVDVFRFAYKFLPFTDSKYIYPETKTITFIKNNIGNFRLMSTDQRILPPNFSAVFKIQDVSGYDPLYLRSYAEFIAAMERGKPNINPPFGFNRIINPQNVDSKLVDLLGVKYILSLNALNSDKLKLVFQEGETKIYENKNVIPRIFFPERIKYVSTKEDMIGEMFNKNVDFEKQVFVEAKRLNQNIGKGTARIADYTENKIVINAEAKGDSFMVLTDIDYPTWHVTIDGEKTSIYTTDYLFRGVFVPNGKHIIQFYNTLF